MIDVCVFGDCRESMRRMIAEGVRVNMVCTSPPYWGLRDYGVPDQLGLESTPEEYVANMVEVFRLVRELLAEDGTLWLNLGDSYAGNAACGKGWVRVVKRADRPREVYTGSSKPESISAIGAGEDRHKVGIGQKYQNWLNENPPVTTGWQPSCACALEPVPGIVFDPFLGSGTTAQVAQNLGRHWLGCELNSGYAQMQKARSAQLGLVLA